MEAARKSGASIFVICSTDETYPELVPPIAGLIKDALPKGVVIVAGYPKDHIDAFKAAGVDEIIHIRSNCYEVLLGLAGRLGIHL
jgi:methylmalonyl-CoA mutase